MSQRRSRDELDRFFELSVDMVGIAGFDGYFKKLGRAWEETLGYTREELLATPFVDFVHPEDRERTASEAAKVFAGTSTVKFTNRYRCRDGSYRWIEWNSAAYPEDDVVYFVARDITERKRAEQALLATEARFRGAIDGSMDAFFVLRGVRDGEGNVVDFVFEDVNTRGATVMSRAREAIVGQRLSEIVPEARPLGFFEKYERVFKEGKPILEEELVRQPGGASRWLQYQIVPLTEGVALTARDVSPAKQLEADLRESLDRQRVYATELEQKNEDLASEIAERQRAERTLREQQEVMLAMSTPIIQAWASVLVLPIIGTVDNARAAHITERLLGEVVRTRATFAILDLTGVSAVDGATVAHLLGVVRATALLGSRCLVTGISPEIAQAMADLGGDEGAFKTFGLLQDALRYALSRSSGRRGR